MTGLLTVCLYCGGPEESRDHVPSRIFLDRPFPKQLPVVWACIECNNKFSRDEAYVGCLIESVIAGSTDPDEIRRERVGNLLRKTPKLRSKLEAAKCFRDGNVQFNVESERIRNVGLKLARGHAAFELSKVRRDEPDSFWWYPLHLMTDGERDDFDSIHVVDMLGEVGSRGLQRMFVTQIDVETIHGGRRSTQNVVFNDWLDIQEERYRYIAIDDVSEIKIKIIIAEYLAFEIVWTQ
jgi:hypothetical protein